MENAVSAEVDTTSAANSTNGTDKSAVESSPMTAYEEQLKSLQELENEQDEALQALDLKIQEMRKQQADVIMRKEQAKTKALGVRAKLSMLLRASSASPKVRSSSLESPQPTSLPEKRSSSTTNKGKGLVEAFWPSKRSKFNSDASLSKTSTFDSLHMTMDEIVNYPRNEKYPLFNDIRDILAKIISRRYSRPKAKHQATVRITDTRHDHFRIVNNLQDCLKYFVSTSTPPPQSSDTPASNQSDVSAKLKDHGRSHDTSTFTPYESPLQRFRSFQYFGGPSGRSMAYSNPVDTSRNLCTFELAGGNCNDDTCASRHFRDFDMTGTDVMQDLLTYAQGEYEDGRSLYPKTLKRIFASLDAANSTSPGSLIRTAADCRRRLPDERLQKVSFVPSIARRSEKVNRRTAPHSVKSVSQKLPMTSALQRVLLSGSSGDTRYFDVDERNYPRDPKNIQGWIRAVVAALPSSNFADYDKTNSKSLDLDGAINILRQALARNPSSDLLWCLYVELWLYRGDLKMFEREMEQAIRNVPFSLDLMWYKVLAAPTVEEQIRISDQLLEHFNSEQAITSIGIVASKTKNVSKVINWTLLY
jgi:tetratricopeptide (TPR) repeat protein